MKKLKNQKGFTLMEMLICVVTLLILAGICSAGSNIAMNSYNRSLFESNSQMLESTLTQYLGDIMRHATLKTQDITPPEGGVAGDIKAIQSITNKSYGIYDGWIDLETKPDATSVGTDTGRIMVHKTPDDSVGMKLLNEKVYTKALKISGFKLEYDSSKQCIIGTYNIESTVVPGLARECSFKYRNLMAN